MARSPGAALVGRSPAPRGGQHHVTGHRPTWFSVLLFDLRGSGASQGAFVTLGAREVRDVGGAIDFLVERGLAPRGVNLLGFSMGAATALLAAEQEPLVRAVAADSAYVDLASIVQFHLAYREPWLRAFQPGVFLMGRVLLGISPERIRPIEVVPALAERTLPLLAIYGGADTVVPFEHARRLVSAYGPEAHTYFLDDSEHMRAYEHEPDIYTGRLAEFFSNASYTRRGAGAPHMHEPPSPRYRIDLLLRHRLTVRGGLTR
jgi:uncharacterized protein